MTLKGAITQSEKSQPMFLVAIKEIFLLTLHSERSVKEALAFWGGLAGITGNTYVNRRGGVFILLHFTLAMMQKRVVKPARLPQY